MAAVKGLDEDGDGDVKMAVVPETSKQQIAVPTTRVITLVSCYFRHVANLRESPPRKWKTELAVTFQWNEGTEVFDVSLTSFGEGDPEVHVAETKRAFERFEALRIEHKINEEHPIELNILSHVALHPDGCLSMIYRVFGPYASKLVLCHGVGVAESGGAKIDSALYEGAVYESASGPEITWDRLREIEFRASELNSALPMVNYSSRTAGRLSHWSTALEHPPFTQVQKITVEDSRRMGTLVHGGEFVRMLSQHCTNLKELHFIPMTDGPYFVPWHFISADFRLSSNLMSVTLPCDITDWVRHATRDTQRDIDVLCSDCRHLESVTFNGRTLLAGVRRSSLAIPTVSEERDSYVKALYDFQIANVLKRVRTMHLVLALMDRKCESRLSGATAPLCRSIFGMTGETVACFMAAKPDYGRSIFSDVARLWSPRLKELFCLSSQSDAGRKRKRDLGVE